MCSFYLVDFIYSANRKIKSLPEFHSIRWSAWIRFGFRKAGLDWDKVLCGVLTFRNSNRPIEKGELIRTRLILNNGSLLQLSKLQNGMSYILDGGEFTARSLNFVAALDATSDTCVSADLKAFDEKMVLNEVDCLQSLKSFHIVFTTPMRLTLPPGFKTKEDSAEQRFAHPDFFAHYPYAIAHLADKNRLLNESVSAAVSDGLQVPVHAINLDWTDVSYNQHIHKTIGGIVGAVKCGQVHSRELALSLVCGQYLGCGKSSRLGYGFYVIPELEDTRKIVLPYSL